MYQTLLVGTPSQDYGLQLHSVNTFTVSRNHWVPCSGCPDVEYLYGADTFKLRQSATSKLDYEFVVHRDEEPNAEPAARPQTLELPDMEETETLEPFLENGCRTVAPDRTKGWVAAVCNGSQVMVAFQPLMSGDDPRFGNVLKSWFTRVPGWNWPS